MVNFLFLVGFAEEEQLPAVRLPAVVSVDLLLLLLLPVQYYFAEVDFPELLSEVLFEPCEAVQAHLMSAVVAAETVEID